MLFLPYEYYEIVIEARPLSLLFRALASRAGNFENVLAQNVL